MNHPEASKAIADIWDNTDPLTLQLSGEIGVALNNPALPMLMRCLAMAHIIASAADGLAILAAEEGVEAVNKIHRIDTLPDLVLMLRASADLFDVPNAMRRN